MWPDRRRKAEAALAVLALTAAPATPAPIRVAVAARSVQPGELAVFTMHTGPRVERVKLRAFERDIPVFRVGARTWRALVGIDLDVRPRGYLVAVEAESDEATIRTTYDLRVRPRHFPTRTLVVDEAFVNPPADARDRIRQDAETLERVWTQSAPERLWTGRFVRPVPGRSVSRFGTRSVFNGEPGRAHGGADFRSPVGTPVEAPNNGRIVLARNLYFSGNTVIVDHGLGLFSMLAHLSTIEVAEGTLVSSGQVVGRVGATGRVTGPHLHWAVRASGARVDPLGVLALLGKD
jgi:murein DD-endopeptidase MepM/ murein hydrolase activator NlpD